MYLPVVVILIFHRSSQTLMVFIPAFIIINFYSHRSQTCTRISQWDLLEFLVLSFIHYHSEHPTTCGTGEPSHPSHICSHFHSTAHCLQFFHFSLSSTSLRMWTSWEQGRYHYSFFLSQIWGTERKRWVFAGYMEGELMPIFRALHSNPCPLPHHWNLIKEVREFRESLISFTQLN